MTQRFDVIDLGSAAKVTSEGWIFDKTVLSRAGVFNYTRADGSVRREYRPPDEVFHEDSLKSLRGVPVTIGHPGKVTKDTHTHTIIGAVLSEGERADNNVLAEVVIHAPNRMGSKRELSLGYSVVMDEVPGVTPGGEKYDAIQRTIRINHLAVVERGRAGNARLRLDAEDAASCDVEFKEDRVSDNLVSVRLDGIEYKAAPEVARNIEKLNSDLAAQKTRADKAEAERDSLTAAATKHDEAVKAARSEGEKAARARASLEATAKAHGVEVKADQTDRAVRVAVVTKLNQDLGGKITDEKSDEYVQFCFDSATAEAEKSSANGKAQGSAARGDASDKKPVDKSDKKDEPPSSSAEARKRMIAGFNR